MNEWPGLYKEILRFYAEQNQGISDFFNSYGAYTKSARKVQQYVNTQIEKYIKEVEKSLED